MLSGLLTSHWLGKRLDRHWQAARVSLARAGQTLFLSGTDGLGTVHTAAGIDRRALEALKGLEDMFASDIQALRLMRESNSDAVYLSDCLDRMQVRLKRMAKLRELLLQGVIQFVTSPFSFDLDAEESATMESNKLLFLAAGTVQLLQLVLQHLIAFQGKCDAYLRYWEHRWFEYTHWYWVETTPWFWGQYLLQKYHLYNPGTPRLHPKQALQAKLKTLRELRAHIAESTGRLMVQLGAFKNIQTTDELQTVITSSMTQLSVAMRLISGNPTPQPAENQQPEENQQSDEAINSLWLNKIYMELGSQIELFKEVFVSLSERLSNAKIPNWFSTHWIQIGVGAIVVYFVSRKLYISRHMILQYVKDTRDAAFRFWYDHLEAPLKNIWEAVRYDKTTISVANKLSLKQDIESLGRMVGDFAVDNHSRAGDALDAVRLQEIIQAAKDGDLAEVMMAYEQNIKSPIRNVILGDLIRLVLIQVQKQKVDLEKAMEALDQLLRANELNFQFLATIPAVLLFGAIAYQLRNMLSKKSPKDDLYASIQNDMRNLERMLNVESYELQDEGNIGGLSYKSYGELIYITSKLAFMADRLAGRNRVWFEEDLKEIESEKTNTTQKLLTIQRMHHTYPFIKEHNQ